MSGWTTQTAVLELGGWPCTVASTRFFTQHILEMYGAVHWTAIYRYVLEGPLLGRLADFVAPAA
jgi:hypothetical protein